MIDYDHCPNCGAEAVRTAQFYACTNSGMAWGTCDRDQPHYKESPKDEEEK